MWEDVLSMDDLIEQVKTWIITLEKQGCAPLLKAGAEGVLQAMVLSFGALRLVSLCLCVCVQLLTKFKNIICSE